MANANDSGEPGRDSFPGAPRWVKVLGLIVLVLVLVAVVIVIASGGEHGPGRHTSSDDAAGGRSPAGLPQDATPPGKGLERHVPPAGAH